MASSLVSLDWQRKVIDALTFGAEMIDRPVSREYQSRIALTDAPWNSKLMTAWSAGWLGRAGVGGGGGGGGAGVGAAVGRGGAGGSWAGVRRSAVAVAFD